jgi:AbrB family looped-hinge helix DNA binding protein
MEASDGSEGEAMSTVEVTPDYQIPIPEEVRDAMGIRPGSRFDVLRHGERIELVPAKDIGAYRGFVKGIDTTVERDEDRL